MKRKSKTQRPPPEIIKYFGDSVRNWEHLAEDHIYVELKNRNFEGVLVRSIPVGLDLIATDVKYSFACEVEVVPEDKMDNKCCVLYRKLKNLECELAWKGKILKKGFFNIVSNELQKYIPQIVPSDELVEALHANRGLMKMIGKVKPEELDLKLYSGIDIAKSIQSIEDLLKIQVEFYRKPSRIAWLVRLTEGRYTISMNPYKLTTDICSLLDLVAVELRGLIHHL